MIRWQTPEGVCKLQQVVPVQHTSWNAGVWWHPLQSKWRVSDNSQHRLAARNPCEDEGLTRSLFGWEQSYARTDFCALGANHDGHKQYVFPSAPWLSSSR